MTAVDRAIARAPYPRHGEPNDIATMLRRLATAIEKEGIPAEMMVELLAARGYSSATLGDGGSRSSEGSSSVERAEERGADRWAGKDFRYHELLRDVERAGSQLEHLHVDVMAHASDDDRRLVGAGCCLACAREVKPDPSKDKAGLRLRKGLCPTCYRAWRRYQTADGELYRAEWVSRRREGLTERDAVGAVVRIHTPEPDHDIDLSVELPNEVTHG